MRSDLAGSGESQHPRKVYRTRIKRAASAAVRGYQRADRAALTLASKAIPSKARNHLHAHRELFDGNIHAAVPMPGGRTLAITIPDRLKHFRHAILPAALLAALLIALQANAALTGYGGTHTVSASGNQAIYEASTHGDSLYVGGTLQGSADFGTSYGTTDIKAAAGSGFTTYISKTTGGAYNWTRIITDSAGSINVGGVYASSDAVYVTGEFTDEVDFAADFGGTDIKSAGGDQYGYVTRINADGSYGWTHIFGSTGAYVQPSSLAYDATSATIILTGIFGGGNVQFDTGGPVRTAANGNGFVLWLEDQTTASSYVRDYHLTSTTGIWPTDITTTSTEVLLGGNFETDATFEMGGSAVSAPSTGSDGFIVRLGLGGNYADAQTFGGSGEEFVNALRATPDGSLYVGGTMTANTTFRDVGSVVASASATDAYVLKVSPLDVNEWVRTLGGDNAQTALNGIVVSSKNVVYVGGSYGGTVDFKKSFGGGDTQTSHGTRSAFVTTFSDAAYESTHTIGAQPEDDPTGSVFGHALASSDPDEVIYLAGAFTNTVDFGAPFLEVDSKASGGGNDAYVTTFTARDPRMLSGGSLTYLDSEGTNLSSNGTQELAPTVTVLDDDDTYLAQLTVDMLEDRTWSTTGDTDHVAHAAVIANLTNQTGAASSFTFYVPKGEADTAVALCPGAVDLVATTATCVNRETLTAGNGASVSTIEGTDYWVIAGRSDVSLGGVSLSYPGIVLTPPAGGTSVTEGASATFSVALQVAPTDDVVITPDIDTPVQLSGGTALTFTPENWQTPQDLTFTATDDDVVDGTSNIAIALTFTSSDTRYDGASEPPLALQATDNDVAGISWAPSSLMLDEANASTPSELCMSLDAEPTSNVSFALSSSDTGEATVESPLVITPANWNAATNCIDVTPVDDDLTDGAQVASISITGITSDDAAFAGLTGLATVAATVQDDDAAGFVFDTGAGQTTEAGGQVELCISLTAQPLASVTLPLQTSDSSEGTLSESEITITAGNWNAPTNCVTVTGQDDDLIDDTINYNIITGDPMSSDPAWDTLGAGDVADVSLSNLDNEAAGITISESSLAVAEGGATDTFTVRLDSQPAPGQEVHVTVGGSAPAQLGASPASLTFTNADWNTPQTVTATAVDDSLLEGAHAATITVGVAETSTEAPYLALGDQTLNTAITDNDTAEATVTATSNATEGSTDGIFTVTLDKVNDTGSVIAISYSVLAGSTAVASTHYTALSGTVTIAAGQSSATITVDASGHDNELFQGDRTVQIQLSAGGSITVGAEDTASVLIIDDESATVSLSAAPGQEGGDDIVLTATLSLANNTGSDLTIGLDDTGAAAVAGQDYTAFDAASITIASGSVSGTFAVAVTDDDLLEADTESVSAELSDFPLPAGVSLDAEDFAATTTITDNDEAQVTVSGGSAVEPSTNGTFTVALSKVNATGAPITVNYSTSGTATPSSDFTALGTSVNIADGNNEATITVAPIDDSDIEVDETVIVTLTSTGFARTSVGDPSTATITLADNETASVTVTTPDDTTGEDGATAQICFELGSRPSSDVTIALSSSDSTKVTVPASATIERDAWGDPTCVTATGHDDDPSTVTGTQDVTIVTGDVTSSDSFYDALGSEDVADAAVHHADNDTPGITVTAVDTTTAESASDNTATVRFALSSQPSSDVTIGLSVDDDTEGDVSANTSVVITSETWNDPSANQITVTGVDDNFIDGTITYNLLTAASSSADSNYNNLTANDVTLTNADNDAAGIAINPSGSTAAEGGATVTHSVSVASQPIDDQQIVITATPANSQITLNGSAPGEAITLTFTGADWDTPQVITVAAVDDTLLELDHSSGVTYALAAGTTDPAYETYEIDPSSFDLTITDNDGANAVLSAADADEDAGTMTFTVTLDKPNNTGDDITFDFATGGVGSATAGSDFTAVTGGTISVANGATTGTASVSITDDALLEGNETIATAISGSSTPAVTITENSATGTILDNDQATATVTATDGTAAENPASGGQFTVSLGTTNNTPAGITLSYTVGGGATPDEDYAPLSGQVIIPVGESSAVVAVDTEGFDDELVEGNETVHLTLTGSDNPLVSVSATPATVTILDDDTYVWSLVKIQDALEEEEVPAQFKVVLKKPNNTGSDMAIDVFDTATGSAQSAVDYAALTGLSATIAPGASESDVIAVMPSDDALLEDIETIALALGTPIEGQGEVDELASTLSLTITDNDVASAALSASNGAESENATFTVTLDKPNNTGSNISFTFQTSDGTATAGTDYTAVAGTITVANGANTGTAVVSITDDDALESDETLSATISASTNPAVSISQATAQTTIADNETAAATITASTPSAAENPANNGEFTVALDTANQTGAPITVNFSVSGSASAGSDYAPLSSSVAIANGQSSVTVTIDTEGYNDDLVEGNETVVLTLDSTSMAPRVSVDPTPAAVTIQDDDSYAWSITKVQDGDEDGPLDVQFRVSLNHTNTTGGPMVVTLATTGSAAADEDYEAFAGPITIEAGSDYTDITVPIVDDGLLESPENIVATLSSPSEGTIATATATAAITDNDVATAELTTSNIAENAGDITFTVTLDKFNDTAVPIAFDLSTTGGTAAPDTDYAALNDVTVSVPIGSNSASVTADVVDDMLLEGDETVTATLSGSSNPAVTIATSAATATILDNETATANVIAAAPSVAEGASAANAFAVSLSRVNNTPAPITVNITVGGSATSGADYEALSSSAVIDVGASTTTIALNTIDDSDAESAETIIVTLDSTSAPDLVTIGGQNEATVTIVDNDTLSWSITKLQDGAETGPADAIFRVQLSQANATGGDLTATVTDAGSGSAGEDDYQPFGASVTIAPGNDHADVHVTILDDDLLERPETIAASLGDASEGDIAVSNATALISDNDAAQLSITANTPTATEQPASNGQFTISLDKPNDSTAPIIVAYAVSGTATGGEDYALLSGTANIPAGEQTTTVWVDMTGFDDTAHEADETIVLTLTATDHSGVTISDQASATVTVQSNDAEPSPPPADNDSGSTPVAPAPRPASPIYVPVPAQPTPDQLPEPVQPPVDQVAPDQDADGIDDAVEAEAHNNGDGNGDGIPDNAQRNVASLVSAITQRPVTLAATGPCSEVQKFDVIAEHELAKSDLGYRYPHGLVDFQLGCDTPGQNAGVAIYYDENLGDNYVWRKLAKQPELAFASMQQAQQTLRAVGQGNVTVVLYDIADGSQADDDGKADGKILDPAGFAVSVIQPVHLWWLLPLIALAGFLITRAAVHHHREHRAAKAKNTRW